MKGKTVRGILVLTLLFTILSGMGWQGTQASGLEDGGIPPASEKEDLLLDPRLNALFTSAPAAPAPTGGPDQFGYTYTTAGEYSWIEPTGGAVVVFSQPDDGISTSANLPAPVNIGFPFNFYEDTYTQLYIYTNGFLAFNMERTSPPRTTIPHPGSPNGILSPFGDDLVVGGSYNSGQVIYKTTGAAPNRQFVVAWKGVTRLGSTDLLTFEVVLSEANGDIKFQYQQASGELLKATVGIEDADGVDGLLYLQYTDGIAPGLAVHYHRPAPSYRVKLMSTYRSEFAISGKAVIPLSIRNTGEAGLDAYNFSAVQTGPAGASGWTINFYAADGVTPLTDTTSDGQVDTGPVAQGGTISMTVVVRNSSPVLGEYVQHTITVKSAADPAQLDTLDVQSAVPAPFAQAYVDLDFNFGVGIDTVWSDRRKFTRVTDWFSGSSLALARLPNASYIYLWERNEQRIIGGPPPLPTYPLPYTDIEYALLSRYGVLQRTRVKLTNNATYGNDDWVVTDRFPTATVMNDGRVAVVWVRDITDESTGVVLVNSNIFYAVIGVDGNVALDPMLLTNNTEWSNFSNEQFFQSLSIVTASDTRLIVSWADTRSTSGVWTSDVYYRLFSPNGTPQAASVKVTSSIPGSTLYQDPVMTRLTNSRTLLAYTVEVTSSSTAYVVINNTTGAVVNTETLIPGAGGTNIDAVQLPSGPILLAWSDAASSGISFVLLNGSTYAVLAGPTSLPNPDGRVGGYVSVTHDLDGHAILTWQDEQWTNYLYYALIDRTGEVLTPAMVFYPAGRDSAYVVTSDITQGNAVYDGSYYIFLPTLSR